MVKDLRFVVTKTARLGSRAVEEELDLVARLCPGDTALAVLQRSFSQNSHIFDICDSIESLAVTLHSRLRYLDALAPLVRDLERTLPRPYITPRHPPPDLPHPARIRTFPRPDHGEWDHAQYLSGGDVFAFSCAISADGATIVTALQAAHLNIWDSRTGVKRLSLVSHTDKVIDCLISADGATVVSASRDTTLRVWDAQSGEPRAVLTGHDAAVNCCAITPDGAIIVSGSADGTLKLWDVATGGEITTLQGRAGSIYDCAINADGTTVFATSAERTRTERAVEPGFGEYKRPITDLRMQVWDVSTAVERTAYLVENFISGALCTISPRGATGVFAWGNTLEICDLTSDDEERRQIRGPYQEIILATCISDDGALVATASAKQEIAIWDVRSDSMRARLTGHSATVRACGLSADGTLVALASDGSMTIWDARSTIQTSAQAERENAAEIRCAVSSDDATAISLSGSAITLWDTKSGRMMHRLPTLWSDQFTSFATTPNCSFVIASTSTGNISAWNVPAMEHHNWSDRFHSLVYRTWDCGLTSDGRHAVTVSGDPGGTIKMWDAGNGKLLTNLTGDTSWDGWYGDPDPGLPDVVGCAISPDRTTLVTVSNNSLTLWRLRTVQHNAAKRMLTKITSWVADLRKRYAPSSFEPANLATLTGQPVNVLSHEGVQCCGFSADGLSLVSAGLETIKVWDTRNWHEKIIIPAADAQRCAISADGVYLASPASGLRVWDARSGTLLTTIYFDGRLKDCAWSPTGESIGAVGAGGVYFLNLAQ